MNVETKFGGFGMLCFEEDGDNWDRAFLLDNITSCTSII